MVWSLNLTGWEKSYSACHVKSELDRRVTVTKPLAEGHPGESMPWLVSRWWQRVAGRDSSKCMQEVEGAQLRTDESEVRFLV